MKKYQKYPLINEDLDASNSVFVMDRPGGPKTLHYLTMFSKSEANLKVALKQYLEEFPPDKFKTEVYQKPQHTFVWGGPLIPVWAALVRRNSSGS